MRFPAALKQQFKKIYRNVKQAFLVVNHTFLQESLVAVLLEPLVESLTRVEVALNSEAGTSDAVVCLDTMHALKHLDEQDLVDIGEYLSYHSGLSLASLWMLRS